MEQQNLETSVAEQRPGHHKEECLDLWSLECSDHIPQNSPDPTALAFLSSLTIPTLPDFFRPTLLPLVSRVILKFPQAFALPPEKGL